MEDLDSFQFATGPQMLTGEWYHPSPQSRLSRYCCCMEKRMMNLTSLKGCRVTSWRKLWYCTVCNPITKVDKQQRSNTTPPLCFEKTEDKWAEDNREDEHFYFVSPLQLIDGAKFNLHRNCLGGDFKKFVTNNGRPGFGGSFATQGVLSSKVVKCTLKNLVLKTNGKTF